MFCTYVIAKLEKILFLFYFPTRMGQDSVKSLLRIHIPFRKVVSEEKIKKSSKEIFETTLMNTSTFLRVRIHNTGKSRYRCEMSWVFVHILGSNFSSDLCIVSWMNLQGRYSSVVSTYDLCCSLFLARLRAILLKDFCILLQVFDLRVVQIYLYHFRGKFWSFSEPVTSVADPGSGAFLTPGSGIRDG